MTRVLLKSGIFGRATCEKWMVWTVHIITSRKPDLKTYRRGYNLDKKYFYLWIWKGEVSTGSASVQPEETSIKVSDVSLVADQRFAAGHMSAASSFVYIICSVVNLLSVEVWYVAWKNVTCVEIALSYHANYDFQGLLSKRVNRLHILGTR